MNSGIYILKWENLPYYYYGSSIDLFRRKRNHFNRLRNGSHENFILLNLFQKYGQPIFEVLEYCNIKDIDYVEQKYLDLAKRDKNNVNILPTITGKGRILREETKDKISKSSEGRIFSENHLINLRSACKISNKRFEKKVIDIVSGRVYDSIKEILIDYNINYHTLTDKLSGRIKSNETPYRYLDKNACGVGSSVAAMQYSPTVKQELGNFNYLKP